MLDTRLGPYGTTALRLALAVLFYAHLGLKVFVFTIPGTVAFFGKLGLPAEMAYLTMLAEFVAATGLLLGVFTRAAALLGAVVLLGAIATVHIHNGFFFTNAGGGWEYPGFWALAAVVQAMLGDGAFALGPVLLRTRRPAVA